MSLKRKVGAAAEDGFVFFGIGGGNARFEGIVPLVDTERNVLIFDCSFGLVFTDFLIGFAFGGGSGANVALPLFVTAVCCDLHGGGNGNVEAFFDFDIF